MSKPFPDVRSFDVVNAIHQYMTQSTSTLMDLMTTRLFFTPPPRLRKIGCAIMLVQHDLNKLGREKSRDTRPYSEDAGIFRDAVVAAEQYREWYTVKGLHHLIRTRLSLTPSRYWTKDRCAKKLVQDDMEQFRWPFRFLDLPPELRNLVYRELLSLRGRFTVWPPYAGIMRGDDFCYPEILAACRLTQAEATGLLYGKNERMTGIRCVGSNLLDAFASRTDLGEVSLCYTPPHAATLSGLPFESDYKLLNFTDIKIILQMIPGPYAAMHDACSMTMSQALFALVSKLADHKKVEKIEFSFEHQHMHQNAIMRALWPLTLLRYPDEIKIKGVSSTVRNYLLDERELNRTTISLLRHNTFAIAPILVERAEQELTAHVQMGESQLDDDYTQLAAAVAACTAALGTVALVDRSSVQAIETACNELETRLATRDFFTRPQGTTQSDRHISDKIVSGTEGLGGRYSFVS